MDKDTIRFECLKLSVSSTTTLSETLARAQEFVKFVTDSESSGKPSSAPNDGVKGTQPAGQNGRSRPRE